MRIRCIKPEFWESENLGNISRDARLLFVGLFTCCDDHGRTRASSRLLASRLFPYDEDAQVKIGAWLAELESKGCVRIYQVDGETFLDIPKWLTHQKIDKPSQSKLPPFREDSRGFERIREDSRSLEKNSLGTGNREQGMGTGNREDMSDSGSPSVDPDKSNAVGILTLLNELTGRVFRKTQTNLRIIEARLAESGVDVAGVELMVRRMVDTWKPDTKMREYLRPETLFNKTKFDSYYAARNEPAPNSGRDSASDGAAGRNALISDRERWSRDFQARAAAHVNYPPPPFV